MIKSKLGAIETSIFTVMTALAQKHGAINLAQGFPGFSPDSRIFEFTREAMEQGHNQYAPMSGWPPLNAFLCEALNTAHGTNFSPGHNLTITAGATQAIFTAISALVHPGDEVIVFDPAYDCYKPAIRLAGAEPVSIPFRADFTIPWNQLQSRVTSRTRMIIVNTPHNPGGTLWQPADWQRLADIVEDSSTIILSDEVYHQIVFDGQQHHSALACARLRDRTLATYSFGKSFHITGWKVGYIAGAEKLMREYQKVHQFNVFSVHHPSQVGLLKYLENVPEARSQLAPFYQEKRDLLADALESSALRPLPCHGSYFSLYDYSAISREPDVEFTRRLTRDIGVATIPISVFYDQPPEQHLIRICFAKQTDTLLQAAERLCTLAPRV